MTTKYFEIRDRGTFIPAVAIKPEPTNVADVYLLASAGYGTTPTAQSQYVLLARLACGPDGIQYDPYDWPDSTRTMKIAHKYIIENWDSLRSGHVVCVEYITGERDVPKDSQRLEQPV